MPIYEFLNLDTKTVEEHNIRIIDVDRFLKEHSNLIKLMSAPAIVAGVGRIKNDDGWRENLSRIAESHPQSKLAEEYGTKSTKDIKTKQIIKKHREKCV